jgi:hypothetical protein
VTPANPEPSRPPSGFREIATILAAILLGGAATGAVIALLTSGGSDVALAVSTVTLPLAYGLGLAAWRGLLGVWLTVLLGRSMLRSRGDEGAFRDETKRAFSSIRDAGPGRLPFSWVFVPVAAATGLVAALVMVVATGGAAVLTGVLLVVAATAYGIVLTRLARAGRMPLPDE